MCVGGGGGGGGGGRGWGEVQVDGCIDGKLDL